VILIFGKTGCTPAQLLSALSSDDAGTSNYGQVFTNGFPADLVNAAFGSEVVTADSRARMNGPGTGSVRGTEECLARCGIVSGSEGEGRNGTGRA
jgi:hypothetical protein